MVQLCIPDRDWYLTGDGLVGVDTAYLYLAFEQYTATGEAGTDTRRYSYLHRNFSVTVDTNNTGDFIHLFLFIEQKQVIHRYICSRSMSGSRQHYSAAGLN